MRKLMIPLLLGLALWRPQYALSKNTESTSEWSEQQYRRSLETILNNIQYSIDHLGAESGAIIASIGHAIDDVSKEKQNYNYHWVRDAAIVMQSFVTVYKHEQNTDRKEFYRKLLIDYAAFSRKNQQTETMSGLGEPKFHLDGRAFFDPWGRPQNDGPALRASALLVFAQILNQEGYRSNELELLHQVIKTDLDYLSSNVGAESFDVWEEVKGQHYFTLKIQESVLRHGAEFMKRQNLEVLSNHYHNKANEISNHLTHFQSDVHKVLISSHSWSGGHVNYKHSGLDSTVVLAAIYAHDLDETESPVLDPWILATGERIRRAFEQNFKFNHSIENGFLAGRYPEDQYFGGHIWPVTTLGFAELYYRVSAEIIDNQEIEINELNRDFIGRVVPDNLRYIIKVGEKIDSTSSYFIPIVRSLFHEGDHIVIGLSKLIGPSGEISEQYSRDNGSPLALPDLSWSHASFLRAIHARRETLNKLPRPIKCSALLSNQNSDEDWQ